MIAEGGGFAASLDADSEGEEGKFYVWSAAEIADVLGRRRRAFFARVYGVTPDGNFEGHTILNRLDAQALLSATRRSAARRDARQTVGARARASGPAGTTRFSPTGTADDPALSRAAHRVRASRSGSNWRTARSLLSPSRCRDGKLVSGIRRALAAARRLRTASDYANMIFAALRLCRRRCDADVSRSGRAWSRTLDAHHSGRRRRRIFHCADDTDDVIVRFEVGARRCCPECRTRSSSRTVRLAATDGRRCVRRRAGELYAALSGDIAKGPVGHCGLLARTST